MSKRVFTPAAGQALTKNEKRDLARAARARQAAKARRLVLAKNVLIGLVVAGVIVGAFFFIKSSVDSQVTASPTETAAPPGTPPTAPAADFPPVPAGADAALKTKPVVETPAGTVTSLNVKTLIAGTGAAAANGKKVTVNYVGVSFKDGKEFDASWNRSQTFDLTLGQGGVIKGWDEGLVGVKAGSRVQIDIPADKGYGENPSGGQPGGALRFVVDVLSVS
jgi:peptidylprolyl isomerase